MREGRWGAHGDPLGYGEAELRTPSSRQAWAAPIRGDPARHQCSRPRRGGSGGLRPPGTAPLGWGADAASSAWAREIREGGLTWDCGGKGWVRREPGLRGDPRQRAPSLHPVAAPHRESPAGLYQNLSTKASRRGFFHVPYSCWSIRRSHHALMPSPAPRGHPWVGDAWPRVHPCGRWRSREPRGWGQEGPYPDPPPHQDHGGGWTRTLQSPGGGSGLGEAAERALLGD